MSEDLPNIAAEAAIRTPYAGQTVAKQGQDYVDRITGIYDEIGAGEWLKLNPLNRIELAESVLDDFGTPVNGMYLFKANTVQVATRRAKDSYGQQFEWERVYSVSSTAKTHADAIQMTLVHELGHHVHNTLGKVDIAQFSATMRAVRLRGGTTYAKKDPLEYFAESFALYTFYSTELLDNDPEGYGMIEQGLKRVGLEVKQK